MMQKGTLTTVWDCGSAQFSTRAELNTETGEVVSLESIEGDALEGLGSLDEEYFTSQGKRYDICPDCHSYIVKTTMEPDSVGNGLHEEKKCMGGCNDE